MHKHTQRVRSWYARRPRRELLLLALFVLVSMHGAQVQGWIMADATPKPVTETVTVAPLATPESRRLARMMRRLRPVIALQPLTRTLVMNNTLQALHGAAGTVSETAERNEAFPAFGLAVFPVTSVPDWGSMSTPTEWNRRYEEMPTNVFVPVPAYDLTRLTEPMKELLRDRWDNTDRITAKLVYSTRYFGAYNIDAGEFTGNHPGIDIKLAEGTPVGSVAGGRVTSVQERPGLGRTVIVEHRHPSGETFYSVYGHLEIMKVRKGDAVLPGETIGTIGMTGNTTAPHLHLQIDRGEPDSPHEPYLPFFLPTPQEAELSSIHPILFVERFGGAREESVAVNRRLP